MISVVIPLHNKEKQIENTLQSVFAQTFIDYEIIIVNDGSTDGSTDVVESINDPRIRLINQKNSGVSAARNRGIKEAKGEFIAFLDADDAWKPEYLETQLKLTKLYPECDVFTVNYEFCDTNGNKTSTIIKNLPFEGEHGILSNYFKVASTSHPPLWTSAVMVRKTAIESIGGFPLGIKSGEDLLTWARLACSYKIAYSKRPLAVFNVEGYDTKEKPKRIPADIDIVSKELIKLHKKFRTPYLKDYISFWHKMRCVIFLRLNMKFKSFRESVKAIKWNPFNLKAYALIILCGLPKKLRPF